VVTPPPNTLQSIHSGVEVLYPIKVGGPSVEYIGPVMPLGSEKNGISPGGTTPVLQNGYLYLTYLCGRSSGPIKIRLSSSDPALKNPITGWFGSEMH
jgi:hypothetical protein